MKINKCRVCGSSSLKKIFTLGDQKFTGIFLQKKNSNVPSGNLSLVFCKLCSLLQLENSFDKKILYGNNYGYMSSLNNTMSMHLKNKSENLKKKYNLSSGDLIIDIGSNDGTFLNFFNKSFNLVGVDPTIKKFYNYYNKNILKIDDFFSKNSIQATVKNKKAKLVTSISMFYDLQDPLKFANDIYDILDEDGVWHLEQSYMPAMIKNTSYDTICHEHLEYYSLKSIKYIFDKIGFKIVDIEFNDVNGGSFALTVAKNKSAYKENKVLIEWLLEKEELYQYNSPSTFEDFFKKTVMHKKILKKLLIDLKNAKKKVIGYGASTKGNVILQYCNINEDLLPYISEVNKYKYNKFTPGSNIRIISEKKAKLLKPDFYLVLPWHFKSFIINKEKDFIKNGGRLIFPLPDIEII
jgi:hypothetical protein